MRYVTIIDATGKEVARVPEVISAEMIEWWNADKGHDRWERPFSAKEDEEEDEG